MATMAEVALDLSAKSSSTPPITSPKPLTSPVPSIISEQDVSEEPERSSSASSLSSQDSPPHPASAGMVKPMVGPLPAFHMQSAAQVASKEDEPHTPVRGGAPPNMRPFKMYPFEPMTSMYSQLSTQTVTAAAATAGLYPLGAMSGATAAAAGPQSGLPLSLFDTSAVTLSSPITQYLQQRKRRHEARGSSGSTSSVDSLGMSHSSDALFSASMSPGRDSDSGAPSSKKPKSGLVLPEVDERKDEAYWERRRKNNEAAKRSRDARRAKEEEIALRAAFLEQENLKLRAQVAILKNETAKLHYMLYNRL